MPSFLANWPILREVPRPAWINHHHWQTLRVQGARQQSLIPTGGLQDDSLATERLEPAHQPSHCMFIVAFGKPLTTGPHRHIQPLLTNINSHVHRPLLHPHLRACRSRSALRNPSWPGAASCDCSNSRSAWFAARRVLLTYDLGRSRVIRSTAPTLRYLCRARFKDTRVRNVWSGCATARYDSLGYVRLWSTTSGVICPPFFVDIRVRRSGRAKGLLDEHSRKSSGVRDT
jgi:hypothetical protein